MHTYIHIWNVRRARRASVPAAPGGRASSTSRLLTLSASLTLPLCLPPPVPPTPSLYLSRSPCRCIWQAVSPSFLGFSLLASAALDLRLGRGAFSLHCPSSCPTLCLSPLFFVSLSLCLSVPLSLTPTFRLSSLSLSLSLSPSFILLSASPSSAFDGRGAREGVPGA